MIFAIRTWTLYTAMGLLLSIGFFHPHMAHAALNATVSWTDNSSDETGFRIEKKVGAGSYATLITVGVNVTSYNDTAGLALGTTYCYRVVAFNGFGDATPSNEACGTPSVPAGATGVLVIFAP